MLRLHKRIVGLIAIIGLTKNFNGWAASPMTEQSISRPLSAGESTPAIGLLLTYADSVKKQKRTKSCLGVRISPTKVMTAASCFRAPGNRPVELSTLIAGDGTRASQLPGILEIKTHPRFTEASQEATPYNVAVIHLESFPSNLDYLVPVAMLSPKNLTQGESLKAYTAGCHRKQAQENCVLRFLKTFPTTMKSMAKSKDNKQTFTIAHGKNEISDGSLGSPVFSPNETLLGLLSSLRGGQSPDSPVYLNIYNDDIMKFISQESRLVESRSPSAHDFQLLESEYGSFMPVGSFPVIQLSTQLVGLDLSLFLNGVEVTSKELARKGAEYTIRSPLQEGRNTLFLIMYDKEGKVVSEGEIWIYAGSRTIRLHVPEVKNTSDQNVQIDLLISPNIAARGRGKIEGNAVVFKNVPAVPTIARIRFPDQGLDYTEFLDEKVDSRTLKGGRMQPVTSRENLDFSDGLSGWTVEGNPNSVKVKKGREIKKELEEEKKRD